MKLARAALLLLAAARAPRADAGFSVVDNLVFAALSDWGGQSELPFTTPGQLSAAAALARVADVQHPKLVVSAGGNFLSQGLPGAAGGRNTFHPAGLRWGLHTCQPAVRLR
jgi:hypothetical protein